MDYCLVGFELPDNTILSYLIFMRNIMSLMIWIMSLGISIMFMVITCIFAIDKKYKFISDVHFKFDCMNVTKLTSHVLLYGLLWPYYVIRYFDRKFIYKVLKNYIKTLDKYYNNYLRPRNKIYK
jgi:hypothetical protein